jgi:hypothetical protein
MLARGAWVGNASARAVSTEHSGESTTHLNPCLPPYDAACGGETRCTVDGELEQSQAPRASDICWISHRP